MIKNVKWIFVVLIISSLISFSFVGKNTPTEGLTIGDKAPTFTICGEKQLIDLKDLRGKYVLLSFWASYDALSRMQNATLNHAVAQADNVEMVSVSFDEYKSIFNETIKKDQISERKKNTTKIITVDSQWNLRFFLLYGILLTYIIYHSQSNAYLYSG